MFLPVVVTPSKKGKQVAAMAAAGLLAAAVGLAHMPSTPFTMQPGAELPFYVHEEYAEAFDKVEATIKALAPYDENMPAFAAEHLVDLPILDELRSIPSRMTQTPDPNRTDVV